MGKLICNHVNANIKNSTMTISTSATPFKLVVYDENMNECKEGESWTLKI